MAIACEGEVDRAVLCRVLELRDVAIGTIRVAGGVARLESRMAGYLAAARLAPWIVHRDLDSAAACAPALLARIAPARISGLNLIIPVRQTEAWLLADRDGCAKFLGVRPSAMPDEPETLADAKQALVRLAGRSRRRDIRDGIVPSATSGRKVGPEYVARVSGFVATGWSPDRAVAGGARSLAKLLERIERFRRTGSWARAG